MLLITGLKLMGSAREMMGRQTKACYILTVKKMKINVKASVTNAKTVLLLNLTLFKVQMIARLESIM